MESNLTQELLKLSVAERIQLAEDLWDSVAYDPEQVPITEAQTAEIDRRLARFAQDAPTLSSWEEVKTRLVRE
jgi:putative addiction module component (TIGR02574 family)